MRYRLRCITSRTLVLGIAALLLGACASSGTAQQTLVAHDNALNTRRADLEATSTASMEQVLATLDASENALTRVARNRGRILSTLDSRGIAVTFLPTLVPSTPTLTPAAAVGTPAPDRPTDVPVTPFLASPTPTRSVPTQVRTTDTRLQSVVMASAVGDDDCATTITSQFTPRSEQVYIVARAVGIVSGTRLSSQWTTADGQALAIFDFVPDFDIDDACIWFFATPEDFPFTPGSYNVTLLIDGQVAAGPVRFTIDGQPGADS